MPKQQTRRRTRQEAPRRGRKKVCIFCVQKIAWVDYKDANLLRRYMSDRGKIRSRRVSGNCTQHQREVAVAIKTARELALLPYTQRTVSDRSGPRRGGPRGDRDRDRDRDNRPRAAEPDTGDAAAEPVGSVGEVAQVAQVAEVADSGGNVAAAEEGDE
jgi:ribosomal protein S18